MLKALLKLNKPISLLLATLTYSLGTGIAHYLGQPIFPATFWLGLLTVLSLESATPIFSEYFRLPLNPMSPGESPGQRQRFRVLLLQVGYALLTLAAVAIITLLLTHSLNLSAAILFVLALCLLIVYCIPPLRLSETGYGELITAINLGTLLPAIGFLIQFGRFHRLLPFASFPLTLLALAYLLIKNFPTYATDQKLGRHSLLIRLTWQRAIPIHHFMVLAAFLMFSSATFLGYPWSLIWPVFLALPFAVIQIIWLQRIANGGRTLWNFLTAVASATFGLTAYLLGMTFWLR